MANLIDGIGNEELNQPGSQVAQLWLTGSVIADGIISGANIYSTADIKGVSVYGTTVVSGATVKGTTIIGENVYGTTTVSGATVKGTTVNNANGTLQSTSIGSNTAVYGAKIQAGSGVLASSSAWIVYPIAFTAKPVVIASAAEGNVGSYTAVPLANISVGSFQASGGAPVGQFSWVAVGI